MDVLAQWVDSSGYYRVECNAERTVLSTFYSADDTDPAVSGLIPAPDYVPAEPWIPAGERFAIDWESAGDYIRIDGVWYLTN